MVWMLQRGLKRGYWIPGQKRRKTVQDYWRDVKAASRKFCKGWGANINSQVKKDKKILLSKLKRMDREVDDNGLSEAQWQERYDVENS
jgi:hypothetical protein